MFIFGCVWCSCFSSFGRLCCMWLFCFKNIGMMVMCWLLVVICCVVMVGRFGCINFRKVSFMLVFGMVVCVSVCRCLKGVV